MPTYVNRARSDDTLANLRASLNDDQKYLMTVMAHTYLEHGRWPMWHYVQAQLDRRDIDAEETIKSLPFVGASILIGRSYGLARFDRTLADDSRPALTVAASLHLQELLPTMGDPFIKVLQFLIESQLNTPVSPNEVTQMAIHSSEIKEAFPEFDEALLIRLREILDHEPPTTGSSAWGGEEKPADWTRYLNREILKYRDVKSVEEYVEKVSRITSDAVAEAFPNSFHGPVNLAPGDRAVPNAPRTIATVPAVTERSPGDVPPYVKASLIEELRQKSGTTNWNLDKLLKLIEELNSNYAAGNAYASHALLRAILDHTPPAFGLNNFDQVASNHSWSRTDKTYVKNLRDFRNAADDVLHRQLRKSADIITLHDMPSRAYVNAFIRGLVDVL